jgi:hypothetical protein
MSIEVGKGLAPEKRNELVKRLYGFVEANKPSIFGTDNVSINPKYLESNQVETSQKPQKLEHLIYTHHGRNDWRYYSSESLWRNESLRNQIVKSVLISREADDLHYSMKLGEQRKIIIDLNESLRAYLFAEANRDSNPDDGRKFIHKHVVLVPKESNIPIEKIPFMTYKDVLEKLAVKEERDDGTYYAPGKIIIPLLEVE